MSFATIYACYMLLQNSNKREVSKSFYQQSYIHHKPIKGRKFSIKTLRKNFKKGNRGGYCL